MVGRTFILLSYTDQYTVVTANNILTNVVGFQVTVLLKYICKKKSIKRQLIINRFVIFCNKVLFYFIFFYEISCNLSGKRSVNAQKCRWVGNIKYDARDLGLSGTGHRQDGDHDPVAVSELVSYETLKRLLPKQRAKLSLPPSFYILN